MNVVVTGASGFVGRALCAELVSDSSFSVLGISRSDDIHLGFPVARASDFFDVEQWKALLAGADSVVHLAGLAHLAGEDAPDLERFREVNVEGSLTIARAAIENRVKRFVFVSSIGVHGASTRGEPITELSPYRPVTPYGASKLEAEEALKRAFSATCTKLVIIRPPLIYGAEAPGNFGRLLMLVARGLPSPFAMIRNQRSMVSLRNLIDFIRCCIEHSGSANQTFLVADDQSFSTHQVMCLLAEGMSRRLLMLPVPDFLLRLGANALRKRNLYQQLCGSLLIDTSKASELLAWRPPYRAEDELVAAGSKFKTTYGVPR